MDISIVQNIVYIISSILFISGIKMLGKEDTAVKGNFLSALAMLVAVLVTFINVTNPLADSKIYDNAVKLYKKNINKYDSLLSATEVRENFFYKKKPLNFPRSPWPRSQDLEPLISLPFVINILKKISLIIN